MFTPARVVRSPGVNSFVFILPDRIGHAQETNSLVCTGRLYCPDQIFDEPGQEQRFQVFITQKSTPAGIFGLFITAGTGIKS